MISSILLYILAYYRGCSNQVNGVICWPICCCNYIRIVCEFLISQKRSKLLLSFVYNVLQLCGSTEVVQAHSSFTKVWKKHSMVCVAHFNQLCATHQFLQCGYLLMGVYAMHAHADVSYRGVKCVCSAWVH